MRILWAAMGLICVGLGLAGVALPLLPTVPFMLLAAFCFARSSERLHNWLLSHPRFGPAIVDWQTNGSINPRVKRISTLSIAAVFGLSIALGLRPLIIFIQGVTLLCVLAFIWSRPNC
ncbi:Inner membrane protein YbaN [Roseovarius litorisediminis]|uniref:Inner membrane protein YbaN n=1 Tax=Roseovarius litorisediminis TaxID=1312363 RepID=A0A1Y5SN71_9RHOB|nr:YbaN family protein [Roseovarius litorisediminis]SLN43424.1 Inner membrane protein YbaN [Roseovarius litorisediminis]